MTVCCKTDFDQAATDSENAARSGLTQHLEYQGMDTLRRYVLYAEYSI
jgi:hypothetical protein